jgi:hypothetical protein
MDVDRCNAQFHNTRHRKGTWTDSGLYARKRGQKKLRKKGMKAARLADPVEVCLVDT